jgi:ribulose-phosphate 3-epimerase
MSALKGVAPSVLAADFARLGAQVAEVLDAGASVIHIDVMDGHFVPPITMGALVVDALKPLAAERGAVLDVHLMVDRPERQVADFASAGADNITIHAEATPHRHYAVQAIRAAGCRAGVALNPGTPVEALAPLAGDIDLALIMTVNPGWGGQAFIAGSEARIARARELVGPDVAIEVDGGIDARTAGPCAQSGATVFVAGSAVFGAADPAQAVRDIAAAITS